MLSERKTISPFWYYTLISGVTTITFIAAGAFAFTAANLRIYYDEIVVYIASILLLWKGVAVSFVVWLFARGAGKKEYIVNFIGSYLGRFYGFIIGGFLGAGIAHQLKQMEVIGGIAGALLLYFAGRWTGSKVSTAIGVQLDRIFTFTEAQVPEKTLNTTPSKKLLLVLLIVIYPLIFVVIGMLINYSGVKFDDYVEYLPISRIVAIVLSIFPICFLWLMKTRWMMKFQSSTTSPISNNFWLGISLAMVPVVYGFTLFLAVGASILELALFAMASSIAAIIWSVNYPTYKHAN